MVRVLDLLWEIDPQIRLLVGGRGNQEHLLNPAVKRGQVVMLGSVGPEQKALIFRVSQALLCPGRIGLIAVESLAVGLPILSTDWDLHAPEVDYLTSGKDIFASSDRESEFSRLVLDHLLYTAELPKHVGKDYPTIEDMAHNFAGGVTRMLTS
jgi:hypothetical protein